MIKKDLNKISISSKQLDNNWHLMDAENKILGRFSSNVAGILIGKGKVGYAPNLATGDFVVVINAEKIVLSGNKVEQKEYFRHSGYPGGEKTIPLEKMLRSDPEKVIINAVKGMLPKNKLKDVMLKRLKVFSGDSHPYQQQLLNNK